MDAQTPQMNPIRKNLLGGYCLVLTVLVLYLIIALLPAPLSGSAGGQTAAAVLFGAKVDVGVETRLLLLVALVGALGASIHMATSFTFFAGKLQLNASWLWWYLLRPFIGAAVAIILYFVVRGVLFATTAESKDVSLFGILAFSGLAGMFSKQAIEWLRQIFDQMFRKVSDVD